ncbi:hypothetical protein LZ32DRAFT_87526 [Colletotrichum eremochloae]|nr:hypothetical protein LZ32DRAFT_87526 [Colletotrichum eremochloae]
MVIGFPIACSRLKAIEKTPSSEHCILTTNSFRQSLQVLFLGVIKYRYSSQGTRAYMRNPALEGVNHSVNEHIGCFQSTYRPGHLISRQPVCQSPQPALLHCSTPNMRTVGSFLCTSICGTCE